MLLTLSTTHQPATDLGFLLYKHPDKVQNFKLSYGEAHVFYPEATNERCTVAMYVDVDPIKLTRRAEGIRSGFPLQPYVNDRPYAASSFLSSAIAKVFSSALNGSGKEDFVILANSPIDLEVTISSLPCYGGETLLERLFAPLGYELEIEHYPLDATFPDWGESRYYTLTLRGNVKLQTLLQHLYVLIPVLDNDKHYWVGEDEIRKLLDKAKEWLPQHPERKLITTRYLKNRRSLAKIALQQLMEADTYSSTDSEVDISEAITESKMGLHAQRLERVFELLKESGAKRVLDLGCGEGKLLRLLLKEKQFTDILGIDVSYRVLEKAIGRLKLDRLSEQDRSRLTLTQGSLLYRDVRLEGYDAAALVEVIEHLDPFRLAMFEETVFACAKPKTVIITTPNREYNVMWEDLPEGKFRHNDHRFEWTRTEFKAWADKVAERYSYSVEIQPLGPEDELLGGPSQLALFQLQVKQVEAKA